MRVLISGGTGFIGRSLTGRALERRWETYVMTRRPDSPAARRLASQGVRLLLGDVTARESVKAALEVARPDVFFHVAGWYEMGVPARLHRAMRAVNVEGTEHALALAAEAGVRRTIYISTTTALGDTGGTIADERFERRTPELSIYEKTKTEAHHLALRHQAAGENVIVACPAQVIGPGDHSAFGIMARLYVHRRMPPIAWAPEGTFTFAHVEDVAEGLASLAKRGHVGETYFLAGHVLSLRQLMGVWEATLGRRPVRLWLPRPLALAQGFLLGPLLRLFGQPAFLSIEVVRSGYVSFQYSSKKAETELGLRFRPADQAWRETLLAEQEAADGASREP
jgi:dihydroflavonol-4-reductase